MKNRGLFTREKVNRNLSQIKLGTGQKEQLSSLFSCFKEELATYLFVSILISNQKRFSKWLKKDYILLLLLNILR